MVRANHFRIEIGSKQPEGYPFNASSSAGEAKGVLKVPFKSKSLDRMLKRISHINDATGRPSVTEEKLKKIGGKKE